MNNHSFEKTNRLITSLRPRVSTDQNVNTNQVASAMEINSSLDKNASNLTVDNSAQQQLNATLTTKPITIATPATTPTPSAISDKTPKNANNICSRTLRPRNNKATVKNGVFGFQTTLSAKASSVETPKTEVKTFSRKDNTGNKIEITGNLPLVTKTISSSVRNIDGKNIFSHIPTLRQQIVNANALKEAGMDKCKVIGNDSAQAQSSISNKIISRIPIRKSKIAIATDNAANTDRCEPDNNNASGNSQPLQTENASSIAASSVKTRRNTRTDQVSIHSSAIASGENKTSSITNTNSYSDNTKSTTNKSKSDTQLNSNKSTISSSTSTSTCTSKTIKSRVSSSTLSSTTIGSQTTSINLPSYDDKLNDQLKKLVSNKMSANTQHESKTSYHYTLRSSSSINILSNEKKAIESSSTDKGKVENTKKPSPGAISSSRQNSSQCNTEGQLIELLPRERTRLSTLSQQIKNGESEENITTSINPLNYNSFGTSQVQANNENDTPSYTLPRNRNEISTHRFQPVKPLSEITNITRNVFQHVPSTSNIEYTQTSSNPLIKNNNNKISSLQTKAAKNSTKRALECDLEVTVDALSEIRPLKKAKSTQQTTSESSSNSSSFNILPQLTPKKRLLDDGDDAQQTKKSKSSDENPPLSYHPTIQNVNRKEKRALTNESNQFSESSKRMKLMDDNIDSDDILDGNFKKRKLENTEVSSIEQDNNQVKKMKMDKEEHSELVYNYTNPSLSKETILSTEKGSEKGNEPGTVKVQSLSDKNRIPETPLPTISSSRRNKRHSHYYKQYFCTDNEETEFENVESTNEQKPSPRKENETLSSTTQLKKHEAINVKTQSSIDRFRIPYTPITLISPTRMRKMRENYYKLDSCSFTKPKVRKYQNVRNFEVQQTPLPKENLISSSTTLQDGTIVAKTQSSIDKFRIPYTPISINSNPNKNNIRKGYLYHDYSYTNNQETNIEQQKVNSLLSSTPASPLSPLSSSSTSLSSLSSSSLTPPNSLSSDEDEDMYVEPQPIKIHLSEEDVDFYKMPLTIEEKEQREQDWLDFLGKEMEHKNLERFRVVSKKFERFLGLKRKVADDSVDFFKNAERYNRKFSKMLGNVGLRLKFIWGKKSVLKIPLLRQEIKWKALCEDIFGKEYIILTRIKFRKQLEEAQEEESNGKTSLWLNELKRKVIRERRLFMLKAEERRHQEQIQQEEDQYSNNHQQQNYNGNFTTKDNENGQLSRKLSFYPKVLCIEGYDDDENDPELWFMPLNEDKTHMLDVPYCLQEKRDFKINIEKATNKNLKIPGMSKEDKKKEIEMYRREMFLALTKAPVRKTR